MKSIGVAIVVVMSLTASAAAMGPPALQGHHQIGIHAGMWNQTTSTRTETGIGGVETTVGTSGGMGGVSYAYWMHEGFAVQLAISGLLTSVETDVGIGTASTETGSIARIMVGGKKSWPSAFGSGFNPFVSASIGPFVGHQDETRAELMFATESRTETAVGGVLAGGTDIRIGSRFITSAAIGYNLMTDFNNAIGGSRNYSGPEFSFGLGIVLGRM